MATRALFFAVLRDRIGSSELPLDQANGRSVGQAWDALVTAHAGLTELRAVTRFAINGRFVPADAVIQPGDEVAFLPPMSGG